MADTPLPHLLLIRPFTQDRLEHYKGLCTSVVKKYDGWYDGWDAAVQDYESTYQWWFYFKKEADRDAAKGELLHMGFKLGSL